MRRRSLCAAQSCTGTKTCRDCKNLYMRRWRKRHPLKGEALRKDRARSYAHVYLNRGLLKRKLCEVCAEYRVEMHHDDYSKPLAVRWFCRRHHLALHGMQIRTHR